MKFIDYNVAMTFILIIIIIMKVSKTVGASFATKHTPTDCTNAHTSFVLKHS